MLCGHRILRHLSQIRSLALMVWSIELSQDGHDDAQPNQWIESLDDLTPLHLPNLTTFDIGGYAVGLYSLATQIIEASSHITHLRLSDFGNLCGTTSAESEGDIVGVIQRLPLLVSLEFPWWVSRDILLRYGDLDISECLSDKAHLVVCNIPIFLLLSQHSRLIPSLSKHHKPCLRYIFMNDNSVDPTTEVEYTDLIARLLSGHPDVMIIHHLSLSPFRDERQQKRVRKVKKFDAVTLTDFYEVCRRGEEEVERWIERRK